jgi:hypothetical protein
VRRLSRTRVARWAAFAVLSLAVFEACSNSGTDITPPPGPPIVAFASPPYSFGCDNVLVVHLSLNPPNITLRPPYYCGTTPQCGTMLVTLLSCDPSSDAGCSANSVPLASARAATADVQLDLSGLDAATLSQTLYVKAEFYGDSLLPFVIPAGGQGTASISVSLTPQSNCSSAPEAGAGGAASSNAGAGGAEVGAGGEPSSAGASGSGGAAGSGGTTSNGGASASAGEAGFGG